jgi:hypothetical protein
MYKLDRIEARMTLILRDFKGFFKIYIKQKNPFKSLKISVIRVTILSNYIRKDLFLKNVFSCAPN